MSARTGIEWTDATWNPIRGCSRVSEGCRNCYAEKVAHRFSGPGKPYEGLTRITNGHPQWTGDVRLVEKHLLDPLKWRKPKRIFVNSMSDLFHENVPDEWIDKIFAVMALCPQHTFQVLTKRPDRMMRYCCDDATLGRAIRVSSALAKMLGANLRATVADCPDGLPGMKLPNVWLGVSVENQGTANERVPLLLQTPAAVRFISAEPLLGPLDLTAVRYWDEVDPDIECEWNALTAFHQVLHSNSMDAVATEDDGVTKLDWVICGGESGPNARPMDPDWARGLRDQCHAAGVAFFFKQWGEWGPCENGEVIPNPWDWDNPAQSHEFHNPGRPRCAQEIVYRVGKNASGATLDGREWRNFPEVK